MAGQFRPTGQRSFVGWWQAVQSPFTMRYHGWQRQLCRRLVRQPQPWQCRKQDNVRVDYLISPTNIISLCWVTQLRQGSLCLSGAQQIGV